MPNAAKFKAKQVQKVIFYNFFQPNYDESCFCTIQITAWEFLMNHAVIRFVIANLQQYHYLSEMVHANAKVSIELECDITFYVIR